MGEKTADTDVLTSWYEERIGKPVTTDEAHGYWVYVLGLVLGIAGVALTVTSSPSSLGREASIVLGGAGLAFLITGPIIRLPLRKEATYLTYVGVAACLVALAWFVAVYPAGWNVNTGSPTVMLLYTAGLLIIGVAGFVIPLVTDRVDIETLQQELTDTKADEADLARRVEGVLAALADSEADADDLAAQVSKLETALGESTASEAALEERVETLQAALADSAADETDLARRVDELLDTLADAEADEDDLARRVEALESELGASAASEAALEERVEAVQTMLADASADEADLAARIERLQESNARFEVYEDNGGEYRWRLRHRNTNVIATSGEGYTRRHNAQKGLQSVRRNALGATVMRVETEADLPDEELFEPAEEATSQATFELYEDSGGEYRWRLRHDNGNLVANGSEGYATPSNLRRAVGKVRDLVGPADYLRFDPTGFEVYEDAAGEYRWRLVHRNGNILAASTDGYTRRNDANRAVERIQTDLESLSFERFEDEAGEYRWRLRAGNDQLVADSGEGYSSKSGRDEAIDRIEQYAPEADVLDIGRGAFEVYEDKGGEYRWRLRHRNGNILADSGEGYASRRNSYDGIERVKRHAPNAETDETDL